MADIIAPGVYGRGLAEFFCELLRPPRMDRSSRGTVASLFRVGDRVEELVYEAHGRTNPASRV